ncbi:MAG: hypothetical protein AUJ72_03510 [Candidatus Omnitrophica bacterium CG1_02_46_14]|nr:MAG: hypothetical protein AUJ72_03510 [Candidatus Omnitrophica bacterium CG1_02_46_14]
MSNFANNKQIISQAIKIVKTLTLNQTNDFICNNLAMANSLIVIASPPKADVVLRQAHHQARNGTKRTYRN